jgi:His Kinase A (phospho-acceptor) domain
MREETRVMHRVRSSVAHHRRRRIHRRRSRCGNARRFASTLSHDARTPLTVIGEYVSLMRDGLLGPINDEQARALDVIADRAGDLNSAIDDALAACHLSAGQLRCWPGRQPLGEIVGRIRPRLLRKASVKGVDLHFDVANDLPEIYCDEETFARALTHIAVFGLQLSGPADRMNLSAKFDAGRGEVLVDATFETAATGGESIAATFGSLARSMNAGQKPARFSRELRLARRFLELNLASVSVITDAQRRCTVRVGIPIAEPIAILERHLTRAARARRRDWRVSVLTAAVRETIDGNLAQDVDNFLSVLLDPQGWFVGRAPRKPKRNRRRLRRSRRRHDLRRAMSLAVRPGLWLLVVSGGAARVARLVNRLDNARKEVNRTRLGTPLPPIAIESLGSWSTPEDAAEILRTARNAAVAAPDSVD